MQVIQLFYAFGFFISKVGVIMVPILWSSFMRWDDECVNHLASCLAQSKYATKVIINIIMKAV